MRRALACLTFAAACAWLPSAHAVDDPVVAVVNGNQIHKSDLQTAQQSLPDQYKQMPLEAIYEPLLNRLIDQQLLIKEAHKRDLEADPAVKAEITHAVDQVLQQQLIQRAITAGTTQERLEQAYNALRTQPGFAQEEVHAEHILVASEDKAKELIAELDKGADFATLAKANSTDPSAQSNSGDLGWFTRDAMVPEFAD